MDHSRTDVNPKTRALVLRASGTKGLVLPTPKSKGTVAVQGMLNKVISQPSVVNQSVTVNQRYGSFLNYPEHTYTHM